MRQVRKEGHRRLGQSAAVFVFVFVFLLLLFLFTSVVDGKRLAGDGSGFRGEEVTNGTLNSGCRR